MVECGRECRRKMELLFVQHECRKRKDIGKKLETEKMSACIKSSKFAMCVLSCNILPFKQSIYSSPSHLPAAPTTN